ncbi:MAG: response regulator [Chitinophagaceae bacterium]|nr:response regulator [Chitinophagaceae bacterium]
MLKKIQDLFKGMYHTLADAGVNPLLPTDQRKSVLLINQLLLISSTINLAGVIFYFISELYLSSLVNLVTGCIFLAGIYFNYNHKLRSARILYVANINVYLLVINIVEGLDSGEYLLYFPAFISVTFMVRVYKDYSELVGAYVLTAIAAFSCIQFVPDQTGLQWIEARTLHQIFASRLILSIMLTIYISYLILKINRDNEALILEEKKFSDSIYNTSLDGVFIINSGTGLVEGCNQQTLQLFDVSRKQEIIGTGIGSWFDEQQISTLLSKQYSNSGSWQGELTVHTKKGRTFYGFVSAVGFNYKEVQYLKLSILDITNVKSAEFELMKAKEKAESAAKMKTRFLSNMSHELRTPLNGIIGTTNLLLQEDLLPSQKAHFDVLKYSSEHMLTLVNDILDHTKMEAGKMELALAPFNMKEFVEKIISQFSNQVEVKGLQFKTYADPALDIELITDEMRLQQVLANLLSNAIKFTERGSITFSASKIIASSSKVTVQFMVQDTGIGIPENKRNEIFESFTQANVETTRKYGGTGLGLTITKELLGVFSSELVLQSEENKGSKFIFMLELPVGGKRKVYIPDKSISKLPELAGIKVLVAEDNEVNMTIVKRFLQKWGIEISEAVNGKAAVELFAKGNYDLLLFDLEMPEMDGAQALTEIRKLDEKIPVMAFTAAVYDNMYADLKEKGFTDFIHKPFRPDDLHSKIAAYTLAKRA